MFRVTTQHPSAIIQIWLVIRSKTANELAMEWLENPDYQQLTKSIDRTQLVKKTEVVLVHEWLDDESRHVTAKLNENGNLVISGQDIGPSVERIFGSDEYEYSHTIPAEFVDAFFELLGARQVTDILGAIDHFGRGRYSEIVNALEEAKKTIPIQFWSRI